MTGDAADVTMDPIGNLRDAHLIALYLHRASAHRDEHRQTRPGPTAHVAALTTVDCVGLTAVRDPEALRKVISRAHDQDAADQVSTNAIT